MKLKFKIRLPVAAVAFAAGVVWTVPVQAQMFVTDPASYTYFAKIWTSDVSTELKMAETVTQGGQLIAQGLQIYNLAMRETRALRNKQFMQAAGYLSALSFPGHSNWTTALRSAAGPLYAAGVWQEMTKPGASIANRIQIADAFGTSMANSLGSCNAAAMQNDGAISQLESVARSMDPLDNTNAALGGMTNQGIAQQLRTQQCQQNIQQQQAQLQMVQLMRQRDYDNAQLTTQQNVQTIAISNPRGITNIVALQTADF